MSDAKIYEFKRPDGEKPHHRKADPAPVTRLKSNHEIFQEVHEDVIGEWQRYAVKNRLNEFILSKLPGNKRAHALADYVSDLNVLSIVEQKLGLSMWMCRQRG